MIFKHINVVIEPWDNARQIHLLRVTMATDHGEFGTQELLPEDQLRSVFDQVWEYLRRQIKAELEKKA